MMSRVLRVTLRGRVRLLPAAVTDEIVRKNPCKAPSVSPPKATPKVEKIREVPLLASVRDELRSTSSSIRPRERRPTLHNVARRKCRSAAVSGHLSGSRGTGGQMS